MMRLGIAAALQAEARTLGRRDFQRNGISRLSSRVVVCTSGSGAARAREAAELLLENGAKALMSWGTAVALDTELDTGKVLIPACVLRHDQTPVQVSVAWQQQLQKTLQAAFDVCDRPLIATTDVLTRPRQKEQLCADTGAVAADMESADIATIAKQAGVPFVALRVVADRVDTTIPGWIPGQLAGNARLPVASLLLALVAHPADWSTVAGLARDFHRATKTMRAIAARNRCVDLVPAMRKSGTAQE